MDPDGRMAMEQGREETLTVRSGGLDGPPYEPGTGVVAKEANTPWHDAGGGFFGLSATDLQVLTYAVVRVSDYEGTELPVDQFMIFFDIFDFLEWVLDMIRDYLYVWLPTLAWMSTGLGDATRGLLLASGLLALGGQLCWHRPFARRRPFLLRLLLAATIVSRGTAAPATGPARHHVRQDWRRPTDLELWSAGQMTLREQMAAAAARNLGGALYSGGRAPPEAYPDGPPAVLPRPPDPVDPEEEAGWRHLVDDDGEELQTHHISFWISSVGMQPATLDVGLMFPLSEERMQGFLLETIRGMDTCWLTDLVEVRPQPHSDYGSYILVPEWLRHSATRVILVDARLYDLGIFPAYIDTPINRYLIFSLVGLGFDAEAEIFIGGSMIPLARGGQFQPEDGCYVQVLRRTDVPSWHGTIAERLFEPQLWRPETAHPSHALGRFIQFQTESEKHNHAMRRGDLRTPQIAAAEIYDLEQDTFWLRAPTERPERLYERGQRIQIVAVLGHERYNKDEVHVVFVDLRPIGRWVEWTVARDGVFHPGNYIQGQRVRAVPGFSVVVQGGRRRGRSDHLHVADGEVLLVVLRPTESLVEEGTTSDDDGSDGPEEDDEDTSADGTSPYDELHSSDISGATASPPRAGDPPRGPPPRPANRSRSPRRGHPTRLSLSDWCRRRHTTLMSSTFSCPTSRLMSRQFSDHGHRIG